MVWFLWFIPMWYSGSGEVLDVSIPDLCRLSYFGSIHAEEERAGCFAFIALMLLVFSLFSL